ncbi:MAG: polysaccharide deacetylase family protein [Betaproteobacteria bacterium]|nr:polysaccharide deacetylase family protein [Betaproteobacteria bacterium]MBI3939015.1 polysaccharide deacetylase family protein [Betaproteobacteria bacterium]
MPRDFVGYGRKPPKFEWPNAARLALNIVVNYEEGAERNPLDGDPERETAGESPYPARPGEREPMQESVYEYGSRVGIYRVIDVFDKYQVSPTIFACAVALERNPPVTQEFVERQYDVVSHGYRWLSHLGFSEQKEREQMQKAQESFQRTIGRRVLGWFNRTPQTINTRRILAEEGFLYDSQAVNDDLPYYQDVQGRPFLIVPYTLDLNDGRFWRGTFHTGRDFEVYCVDSFDTLYRESARTPRMMTVGLHPKVIGRPGRIGGLDRFLAYVREFPDVWLASRTEIARFWAGRFAPPNAWNWPQ